ALREIGDPRALGPLGEALNDPEQGVRAAAAEAIGKIAAQASTPQAEA
ncbi:MAG: HEAT repeat domain-containing protein, partial [Candidatus Hydrogenedentota bacterium]